MRLKKSYSLFFNLIFLIFICLVSIGLGTSEKCCKNWALSGAILGMAVIFVQVVQIIFSHRSILDFRVIFIVLHYFFLFGRIFFYALWPEEKVFWDQRYRYSEEVMLRSALYCVCAVQALYIGLFFNEYKGVIFNYSKKDNKLFYSGLLCIAIGLPCEIITDIYRITSTNDTNSYKGLDVSLGIVDDLGPLLLAGVIILISSNCIRKQFGKVLCLITIAYYGLVMLSTGDRRFQFSAIITMAVILVTKYQIFKRVKVFLKIILSIVLIMALNCSYIIREMRSAELRNIIPYIMNNFSELLSLRVLKETMLEFGISFYSVCNIVKYMPEKVNYLLGGGFFYALITLLPLGFLKNGKELDAKASISTTINALEGNPVGATLVGDMYSNFGIWGIFFLILIGITIADALYKSSKNDSNWDFARYHILFYILISLVRASISQTVRMVALYIIFPYVMMRFLNKIKFVKIAKHAK